MEWFPLFGFHQTFIVLHFPMKILNDMQTKVAKKKKQKKSEWF